MFGENGAMMVPIPVEGSRPIDLGLIMIEPLILNWCELAGCSEYVEDMSLEL